MTSSSEIHTPTSKEVLAALDSTGFLFEQRVAQVFADHQFGVIPNHAFEDNETGKSREVDVRAEYESQIDQGSQTIYTSVNALVECKNTTSPFVILGSGRPEPISNMVPSFYHPRFDPLSLFPRRRGGTGAATLSTFVELGWASAVAAGSSSSFSGTQLVRMNRQSGNALLCNLEETRGESQSGTTSASICFTPRSSRVFAA